MSDWEKELLLAYAESQVRQSERIHIEFKKCIKHADDDSYEINILMQFMSHIWESLGQLKPLLKAAGATQEHLDSVDHNISIFSRIHDRCQKRIKGKS